MSDQGTARNDIAMIELRKLTKAFGSKYALAGSTCASCRASRW